MSRKIPMNCPGKPISISDNHPRTHNLDIYKYSYSELLNIFGLSENYGEMELKQAKKKVLMMHPDKSNYPDEYFIFYRDAFNIILDNYRTRVKSERELTNEPAVYTTELRENVNLSYPNPNPNIQHRISKMTNDAFHAKFNELYDAHIAQKVDEDKFKWFKEETPYVNSKINPKDGSAFDEIKKTQYNNGIIKYNGFTNYGYTAGTSIYGEDYPEDQYISTDPFSKLKFDDVRKVHRDQTVIPVSERDIANVPSYANIEQCKSSRSENIAPLKESEAHKIIQMKKEQEDILAARRIHAMQMREQEMRKKTSLVESAFSLLGFK